MGNILVTNGPFTALEKIAGSFYVLTMKSDKIHLEPRPAFCKGDKLLKQPAEGRGDFSDGADHRSPHGRCIWTNAGHRAVPGAGCLSPADLMISSGFKLSETIGFKIRKEILSLV